MKVLFDANVVIDIMCRAASFPDSLAAYDVAILSGYIPVVSESEVPVVHYVATKHGFSCEGRTVTSVLLELFDVIDTVESDCKLADANTMDDFEDALIAEAACRNGVDLIITRDKTGFADSPVKAMPPESFVEAFKPEGYEYGLVELA